MLLLILDSLLTLISPILLITIIIVHFISKACGRQNIVEIVPMIVIHCCVVRQRVHESPQVLQRHLQCLNCSSLSRIE